MASAGPVRPVAPFAFLPHTADLRVALRGATLGELYAAAGDLVREVVAGDSPVESGEEREIPLAAGDERERFFRFVRELVYLYDAEHFLVARVVLGASIRVWGERFDPARHLAERQLKAVTRHGYELRRDAAGYRVELVFDV